MGRVGIPTKYIFPRGLARGMVVDLWSPRRGGKTENGKGRLGNVYQHTYIGESPTQPAGRLLVLFRRRRSYFQHANKVERGVKLKFSQLGASRGSRGRGFKKPQRGT